MESVGEIPKVESLRKPNHQLAYIIQTKNSLTEAL